MKRPFIILYWVRHRSGEQIEMCGAFPSVEYFNGVFSQREKERGWTVFKYEILKENSDYVSMV